MRYEIDMHDLETRLALTQYLMHNFELGKLQVRHTMDGEECIATFDIRLKPEKRKEEIIPG